MRSTFLRFFKNRIFIRVNNWQKFLGSKRVKVKNKNYVHKNIEFNMGELEKLQNVLIECTQF